MTVKRTTKGMDALKVQLKELRDRKMGAGWFDSARYEDGTPVAGIAAQNEFGNPRLNIPARPFMRPTIKNKSGEWKSKAAKLFKQVMDGRIDTTQALDALGVVVVSDVKSSIVGGNFAPLSPITIALRRLRNNNVEIGGALIGKVAGAIAAGETGQGQLGDQTWPNKDPLRDTKLMFNTLTHEVE